MSGAAKRSDLGVRTATGVVAIVVALGCLWFGGVAWWALVALLSLAMLREWCGLTGVSGWRAGLGLGALAALLVVLLAGELGYPLTLGPRESNYALLVTPAAFNGGFVLALILALGAGLVARSGSLLAGLLYVGLPAVCLFFLRTGGGGLFGEAQGFTATLTVLAAVWATDIGAYAAGRAIGGPKLAARISPNKTWAGVGGAVVATTLTLFVFQMLSLREAYGPIEINYVASLLISFIFGAPIAILAQAGDLFESWLKRRAGVKDSGQLLPGHGGALDRLDGLVPVSVAAALLLFFGHA